MDARPSRSGQALAAVVVVAALFGGYFIGRLHREPDTDIDRLVHQAVTTQPASADQAAAVLVRTSKSIDLALATSAQNLANLETPGYKARTVAFTGDGNAEVRIDTETGSMDATGRTLDIAVQGTGFITLRFNGKDYLTRNGNFLRSMDGDLVVAVGEGLPLSPPINIPPDVPSDRVSIDTSGRVQYIRPGTSFKTLAGQIQLAVVPAEQYLTPVGFSCFEANDRSGSPLIDNPGAGASGTVLSGFLEASNVNLHAEELRQASAKRWQASIDRAIARQTK